MPSHDRVFRRYSHKYSLRRPVDFLDDCGVYMREDQTRRLRRPLCAGGANDPDRNTRLFLEGFNQKWTRARNVLYAWASQHLALDDVPHTYGGSQ